ncbi:MAG: hypothetical protein ACK4HQ_09195 [Brevinematales bacterium]
MKQRMMNQPEVQISLTEVMLFQYLQVNEIQHTYMQKVRQISVLTRTKGNSLRKQLAFYEKRFLDLTSQSTLSPQQQQEIIQLLEEITRINRKLFSVQREAMKEIEALNLEREKKILSLTTSWIRKAKKDPEELMNFVRFVQDKKTILPLSPPNDNE